MDQSAEGNRPPSSSPARRGRSSGLRQLIDSLVCLALAVVLFRTFQVEGYMISTGSMAPTLLGFHKRVVCPRCGHPFALGVAFDQDDESPDAAPPESPAVCPNCGQAGIDVRDVPRNQGDQLLVNKSAYLLHEPRRGEVVVFRNPYKTTQAYVKRIAGLPGESIEIRNGDLYADGRIFRKDFLTQRAMRINVFDQNHIPKDDPDWQPRWVPDDEWEAAGHGFVRRIASPEATLDPSASVVKDTADDPSDGWSWVTYRHWRRSGGTHESSVELPETADRIEFPSGWLPIRFDAETRRLTYTGVLESDDRDRLLALSDNPEYQEAIRQLAALSHLAPVNDTYGYNRSRGGVPPVVVRDLMLSARLTVERGTGEFAVQMTDGAHVYDLVLDVGRHEARLSVDSSPTAARTARLLPKTFDRPVLVEMSLFDRQVLVALDGTPIMEPLLLDEPLAAPPPPRKPVRFGAQRLAARVDGLYLYRDVHYTSTGKREPFVLGPDEYYVLGDNSPVSHDSRRWADGAVHRRLFLGRPFVVHLPSRQLKLRLGSTPRYIRIPDLARVRYIR